MIDRHHILFERSTWVSKPAKALRTTPSLIPKIDREAHEAIHRECTPVPLLGQFALRGTLGMFVPTRNVLDDMDGLMQAVERSTRHQSVHRIERELAGLVIEAIEIQRPYVIEGLVA